MTHWERFVHTYGFIDGLKYLFKFIRNILCCILSISVITGALCAVPPNIPHLAETPPDLPDLTNGGRPDDKHDWNLGPRGFDNNTIDCITISSGINEVVGRVILDGKVLPIDPEFDANRSSSAASASGGGCLLKRRK